MPKKPLRELIADRMRSRIAESDDPYLPPINVLSKEWNVSYPTMRAAVRILVDEGMVELSHGKRSVRILRSGKSEANAGEVNDDPGRSGARLFEEMRNEIISGKYRVGCQLPKFEYFYSSYRVGSATVQDALRRLEDHDLVHKSGKKWYVGRAAVPESDRSFKPRPGGNPVVVLLVSDMATWNGFLDFSSNAAFSNEFRSETTRFGMVSSLAFRMPATGASMDCFPAGLDKVLSHVQELGDRYHGTLIVLSSEDDPVGSDHLAEWVVRLTNFKKPVAYLDIEGRGKSLRRKDLGGARNYFRLFVDETAAVTCAVRALTSLGHRAIGLPAPAPQQAVTWARDRMGLAKEIILAQNPQARIAESLHTEPVWDLTSADWWTDLCPSVESVLGENASGDGSVTPNERVVSVRSRLISAMPSIASLFAAGETTAILAASDRFAQEYYFWFKAAGIKIPQQLSLIGFDNLAQDYAFPISTIDFGLEELAYRAAHLFIGDIPFGHHDEGELAGPCRLVDRGSLAPVPRHGLRL